MKHNALITYGSLCTQFYDLEFKYRQSKLQTQDNQIPFFLDQAHKARGPILEPMCGTGRLMIPILAAGFDIEGFDASPFMLQAFAQKWALVSNTQAPIKTCFLQDFSSSKNYGLIFIPFGSLGLITAQEELKACLRILYNHLMPQGTLWIEVDTMASLQKNLGMKNQITHLIDNHSALKLTTIESYNPTTQILQVQCTYELIKNNTIEKTETEDFYQYLYKFDEMDELLKNTGFLGIKKYQNYDLESASDQKTEILLYECTR